MRNSKKDETGRVDREGDREFQSYDRYQSGFSHWGGGRVRKGGRVRSREVAKTTHFVRLLWPPGVE